jgi:hypothetical protein
MDFLARTTTWAARPGPVLRAPDHTTFFNSGLAAEDGRAIKAEPASAALLANVMSQDAIDGVTLLVPWNQVETSQKSCRTALW